MLKTDNNNDIKKYRDLDGVTMNKLGFGLWWLKNKTFLQKLLYGFIFLIALISWGYTLFSWSYYYAYWSGKDEEMIRVLAGSMTVSPQYLLDHSAQRLGVSSVYMLESSEKYDFYTIVKNPNRRHYGTLSYCFEEGANKIDCGKTYIMPNESKHILSLANEFSSRPQNVKFSVTVFWAAINPHKIPSWKEYETEHLNLETKNLKFIPASQNELTEKINLNTLEFTYINHSPYDYYELPLNIILYRNNTVISVNRYVLKDFVSNKAAEVVISWPGYIGGITEAEITPDINILDKAYSF